MQEFTGKKIVLGVSGGVAAYKAAYLVRDLCQLGAEVRVVMTPNAERFISSLTFQALSGHEVRTTLWDEQAERGMGHIELARWADYLLVAPASANLIAKFAQGLADDLLSTLYLVAEVPVIICPAMNRSMWHHPATQDNVARLCAHGVILVDPEEGAQACGEYGLGRLADPLAIINVLRLHHIYQSLTGKRVVITAGPTREAIDPVRFLSNRSSGKMGYALAMAARVAGAEVVLISGPSAEPTPAGVTLIPVVSAAEMSQAVMAEVQAGDIFIGCAAVADYCPEQAAPQKIKKQDKQPFVLTLSPTEDIVARVAASGKAGFVVGFAAETEHLLANAQKKLEKKQLDMVIANQVGDGLGFEAAHNEVLVLTKKGKIALPIMSKICLAGALIELIALTA